MKSRRIVAFAFFLCSGLITQGQSVKAMKAAIKGIWNIEADTSYHLHFGDSTVLELDGNDLTDSFVYFVKGRCCNQEYKRKRGIFLYMINKQFGMFCYKVESIDAMHLMLRDTHSGELFVYKRCDGSLAGNK